MVVNSAELAFLTQLPRSDSPEALVGVGLYFLSVSLQACAELFLNFDLAHDRFHSLYSFDRCLVPFVVR